MKKIFLMLIAAFASSAYAVEVPVQRVADDAKVVDRVAQASKRDLPQDLLKRILNEDIDALRGKRADGTYDYASFERLEASRNQEEDSVQPKKTDELQHFEIKGPFAYRLVLDVPSRRMLVTKNRRVYVDHVELEYIPLSTSGTQRQSIKVEAWLEPGEARPIDFPEVARQVTATVFAKGDPAAGYGNLVMTLLHAKVVDNADSPYADAVSSAKAAMRAIDNADIPSIRNMAARMHDDLAPRAGAQSIDVVGVRPVAAQPPPTPSAAEGRGTTIEPTPSVEIYMELQSIEDLLTGSDAEKREGLDKLHQLVRRLRPH